MNITVRFFGKLAEVVHESNIQLSLSTNVTIDDLLATLEGKYPNLSGETFKVALNEELVSTLHRLKQGDIIALLPPFAGG